MIKIRNVKMEDLTQLEIIENLCFSKEEAATTEAFKERIKRIPDSFFVAEMDGEIAGLVNGPVIDSVYITDNLFSMIKNNPAIGGHQSILGLAVAPQFQGHGVAAALLDHLEKEARRKKRETITLTCKQDLSAFYEKYGYRNCGVSASQHGGVSWYNMCKKMD
ncbi:GNAT family N-acetyltransferase [Bacillus sp. AFS073361]|uniref:GNAT family N-acetyltransferase n=1 Tax=Bacillus sp. AFS073361 TaxID=2033511 RepID=UPI000BF8683C|nr:N-acetyltransferase [Bacillus sp. AFS073361]PFP27561.1 GNAT family N-acetyltransferase [Bacillus sp. AFS073361]